MKKIILTILLLIAVSAGIFFAYDQYRRNNSDVGAEIDSTSVAVEPENLDDSSEVIDTAFVEGDIEQTGEGRDPVPLDDKTKKYIGEYVFEAKPYTLDDKYVLDAKIYVNAEGDGNFNYWNVDLKTEKKLEDNLQTYGEYEADGDTLIFGAMVTAGSSLYEKEPTFKLFEEEGNFYVKSDYFKTDDPDGKIRIKKIK